MPSGCGRICRRPEPAVTANAPTESTRPLDGETYVTFWHQDSPGVPDLAEAHDRFGWSLAAGLFDSERAEEGLAIGVPLEDIGAITDAGAVNVIYSCGARGLCGDPGNQFWHQDSPGVEDTAEIGDQFGFSLAAGNFSRQDANDFSDDLAIGVPFEDISGVTDAGAVTVLYGYNPSTLGSDPGRLSAAGSQFWHQDSPDVEDTAEAGDCFGFSLAAGDFDETQPGSPEDLAIGVPCEDINGIADAGAVNVIYGGEIFGLDANFAPPSDIPDQFWHLDISNVDGDGQTANRFGAALTVGRFTGSPPFTHGDLAIGIPGQQVVDEGGVIPEAGAVSIIYGQNQDGIFGGLSAIATPDQFWTQFFIHPPIP